VFGGVEIVPDGSGAGKQKWGDCFAIVVPDRTGPTLMSVIKKFILPAGTNILCSNYWKAYDGILNAGMGYTHFKVNHSENYVDPDTGAHTNTIEGKWNNLKKRYPANHD
jgi:hypothetical protein